MPALLDRTADDRLARVLRTLRMRSTFCSHSEFRAPWAVEMPAIADSVSFHAITTGSCWLRLPDGEARELRAGDLALVPHGLGHDLLSTPDGRRGPRVDLLPQEFVSPQYSVLRYGGDGRATQLLCGIVSFDDPAARELLRALPPTLVVEGESAEAAPFIRDTLRLMTSELAVPRPGAEAVATRLSDILVVQAIRAWLEQDASGDAETDEAGSAATGWLRALRDARIGRVIEAIHDRPGEAWTLEGLARVAAMSRSAFSARFAELVGESPVAYLTRWRMNVAHLRLTEGDATVSRLAAELGYRSEAAFTRAFTRTLGRTPSAVRRGA